jgi:hypothetical protein
MGINDEISDDESAISQLKGGRYGLPDRAPARGVT